ncbi:MAG: DUF4404 family protein [Gammaproteobacteria bacterium]|jgi:hypothetical protein
MVQKRLTRLLEELRDELEKAENIDDATRSQIEDAAMELNEFLGRDDDDAERGGFESLQDRLLSLEVEHPRVAAIVGETADLISKLGV